MADEKPASSTDPSQVWERGWAGHEQAQLRRLSRLSLHEKLVWLTEAHEMVLSLERARKQQPSRTTPPKP